MYGWEIIRGTHLRLVKSCLGLPDQRDIFEKGAGMLRNRTIELVVEGEIFS